MQINQEYIILNEFKHNQDIFVVTKGLQISDKVLVLKYQGSSFLYPESYYFIQLEDYFNLRQPDAGVVNKIIQQLCKICEDYKIHPTCMYEEGVTFNHQLNSFQYPKQLIDQSGAKYEYNAFGFISRYLHQNEEIEWSKKEKLYELLDRILKPNSNAYQMINIERLLRDSEEEEIQSKNELGQDEDKNDDSENFLKIQNEEELDEFLEKKKNYYLNSVLFKYLNDKQQIEPESYEDQQFLNIQRYAFVYKEAGFHKLAKTVFSYYFMLIEQLNRQMQDLFDLEQAQEVKVNIPEEEIVKYLQRLSENQVQEGDLLTIKTQQQSKEWHMQRKCRITASNFGYLAKSSQLQRNKLVQDQIYPKFFGNEATRYGNQYESAARDKYIESKKVDRYEVKEFGLLIDPDYIWIAGSPDGIVYQDNQKIGCIEIKCPFRIKDDMIDYKKLDFLKKREDGSIKLSEYHAYYYQCQGIMKLSKVQWCDFIVYTQKDIMIIRVDYDAEFVDKLYIQLNEYFFKHLLVENIYPCKSIHIKQQIMDEEQFEELKNKNFQINYQKQQNNLIEAEEQKQDDEDNGDDNKSCSKTESITQGEEENIESTIPL